MSSKLLIPFLSVILVSIFLQSCIKDKCISHYYFWEPVYKTTAEARVNIKNNPSKIIERPGKIYIRGNYIFLNETDKGIHIIDNSNPSAPRNIAFIDIPGNMDMAVKGNMLYADFYTDLVAINISDPLHVVVTKITENIFPERSWGYGFTATSDNVIVDWVRKDTTMAISCGGSNQLFSLMKRVDALFFSAQSGSFSNATATPFGIGGSMARFTIVNNHLYSVSETSLNVISIANATDPVFNNSVSIGQGIETIYPFKNRLFIGSNSGMFIYDLSNLTNPSKLSSFAHVRSCDPVIADDNNAFVTLRSGNACQGFTNQLDVLDITSITNPVFKKSYPLTNPHGLAKDGSTLFVCDGKDG